MSTKLTRRTLVAGAAIAASANTPAMATVAEPDPIFAALERARRTEEVCDEAAEEAHARADFNHDIDAEATEALAARMALAQTVPTTWAGVAALIGFVAEWSSFYEDFYFQDDDAPHYARSLDHAIKRLGPMVRS